MIISQKSKDKYLAHSVDSNMTRLYLQRGGAPSLMNLPVCPKCERLGLRDKGWVAERVMACPFCGYKGRATHTLSTYLKEGCYR